MQSPTAHARRTLYAQSLFFDAAATLDDLREAVATLEELARTVRRVLGGEHPFTEEVEDSLREAQAALRARDGGVSAIREAVAAMTARRAYSCC